MAKRLFVGNLPYSISEDQLRELFSQHGQVTSVSIITDRETGRSKGFAFIDMPNDDEAQKAIDAVNGSSVDDRKVVVNEAKPREERPRSDFRSGGGGGYDRNRGNFQRDRRDSGRNRW